MRYFLMISMLSFALVVNQIIFGLSATDAASIKPSGSKASSFGIHGVGLPFFKEINELGCSAVRIIISTPVWDVIETEEGINFEKLDYAVKTLQQSDIDVVFTLMPNSKKWGAAHLFKKKGGEIEPTTHADYPVNFELYLKAISSIVERYDGDGKEDMPGLKYSIDCYQLVNEWIWQWRGSKEQYLSFLKASGEMIKQVHPGARIILGGLTGLEFCAIAEKVTQDQNLELGGMFGRDEPQIVSFDSFKRQKPGFAEMSIERTKYILKEGAPYFDLVDFHSYTESYKGMIPSIEVIKRLAPGKEIWSLENAGPFYRYSPLRHCQEIIKRYIVGLHRGLGKIFWSSYNPTAGWPKNFLNLSLLDGRGRKKPAYFVYKFVTHNLAPITSIEKLEMGSGIEAYRILSGSKRSFVVWTETASKTIRLPSKVAEKTGRLVSFTVENSRIQKLERILEVKEENMAFEVSETPVFIFPK